MARPKHEIETEVLAAKAAENEAHEVSLEELDAADDAAAQVAAVVPVVSAATGAGLNLTFEQLMALVTQASNGSAAQIATIAQNAMIAGADRVKPKELTVSETERKSAYNPEGEKTHPRPKLKCHMYFGSAPLGSPKEVSTLTHAEIAELNQLTPGHFRIEKTDGSKSVVEVKGQYNSNRELDRLWILLPEGDENKNAYPRLSEFARQLHQESNRVEPLVTA